MNTEILSQTDYWNQEAERFEKIYSHQKSPFSNLLDRIFRGDMYERFSFTISRSEPISGRSFLDVGCGSGRYSLEYARRGARDVIGIDIAENMLQICRQMAENEGLGGRCSFLHTDLLQFDPEHVFDVSIGIGLFDYISDPLPVLSKLRSVTSDCVIVSFPRLWTWRAPIRKARLSLRGCPVYFYSRSRISNLMRQAGYPKIDISKVGKLFCVVGYARA